MNNQELIDLLLFQTNITTIILVFTALILAFVFMDVLLYLYKKYIKKDKDKKQ